MGAHDCETSEVKTCGFDDAMQLFALSGNKRDAGVLKLANKYISNHPDMFNCNVGINEHISDRSINELHMNLLGKIFFTTLGAWLIGKEVNMKIRGTNEQVRSVANALIATKQLNEEFNDSSATVESVMEKLNIKHTATSEFERQFNIRWPL